MNKKDKEILDYNNKLMKKILKSLLYTLAIFFFSSWGVYGVTSLIFSSMSDTWFIISFAIGIIFTIFFCTFTILDEIKKNR